MPLEWPGSRSSRLKTRSAAGSNADSLAAEATRFVAARSRHEARRPRPGRPCRATRRGGRGRWRGPSRGRARSRRASRRSPTVIAATGAPPRLDGIAEALRRHHGADRVGAGGADADLEELEDADHRPGLTGARNRAPPPAGSRARRSRRSASTRRGSGRASSGRTSRISALPRSVRVAAPTGKAASARSSGQPALRIAAASRPLTSMPTLRWPISTRAKKRSLEAGLDLGREAVGIRLGPDEEPLVRPEPHREALAREMRPVDRLVEPEARDRADLRRGGLRQPQREARLRLQRPEPTAAAPRRRRSSAVQARRRVWSQAWTRSPLGSKKTGSATRAVGEARGRGDVERRAHPGAAAGHEGERDRSGRNSALQ